MRFVRRISATFVVALILLGAQASQVLHELVVRHEICPVHGDVVEGGDGANDAPTSRAANPRARLLAAADEHHGHDPCLAMLGDLDAVTSDVAALAHDLTSGLALQMVLTASEQRRPVPLYRLAPKTSPPV